MRILNELHQRNEGSDQPFLIGPGGNLAFADIESARSTVDLAGIQPGDVVALVGDFDGPTIATMLELLDRGVVLMPLTEGTRADHDYFFESGRAEWVIRDNGLERLAPPTGRSSAHRGSPTPRASGDNLFLLRHDGAAESHPARLQQFPRPSPCDRSVRAF